MAGRRSLIWFDDEPETSEPRRSGRPKVNPFPSAEVEEDFAVRGRKMIELYYKDDGSKTNFNFSPTKHMSKTSFWAYIFVYYVQEKHLANNLQGFLSAARLHFGTEYVSNRASISKNVQLFTKLQIYHDREVSNLHSYEKALREKLRSHYMYIVKKWVNIQT